MSTITKLPLRSTAFADGEPIPRDYTCQGEDVSPPLSWEPGPPGTAGWALIVEDPDARNWIHWVVVNIPAEVTALEAGASGSLPEGTVEGETDFGPAKWVGPCPPSGVHRYVFTLYALSELIPLGPQVTATQIRTDMFGHVLAEGELTGTFRRG